MFGHSGLANFRNMTQIRFLYVFHIFFCRISSEITSVQWLKWSRLKSMNKYDLVIQITVSFKWHLFWHKPCGIEGTMTKNIEDHRISNDTARKHKLYNNSKTWTLSFFQYELDLKLFYRVSEGKVFFFNWALTKRNTVRAPL